MAFPDQKVMRKVVREIEASKRLERIAELIELGDRRLLVSDGPCGNQPPQLTLKEWREIYLLATGENTP
jgi:3-deoxy-D-arabino-heptulosonate 7-phosphate (DAHP) synthase